MKLNGWKRIGIVLSAVWIFGTCVKIHHDSGVWAERSAKTIYDYCMKDASAQADYDKCWNDQILNVSKFTDEYFLTNRDFWLGFILYFVAPIIMGCLSVYICIWISKWIKAGFEVRQN